MFEGLRFELNIAMFMGADSLKASDIDVVDRIAY